MPFFDPSRMPRRKTVTMASLDMLVREMFSPDRFMDYVARHSYSPLLDIIDRNPLANIPWVPIRGLVARKP